MQPRTIIIAQLLISFKMAFLMTGIFSFLPMGLTLEWLKAWAEHFIVAWAIAFVLSLFVSRSSFSIAMRLTQKKSASE